MTFLFFFATITVKIFSVANVPKELWYFLSQGSSIAVYIWIQLTVEGLVNHRHFYWKPIHQPSLFQPFYLRGTFKVIAKTNSLRVSGKMPLIFLSSGKNGHLTVVVKMPPLQTAKKKSLALPSGIGPELCRHY